MSHLTEARTCTASAGGSVVPRWRDEEAVRTALARVRLLRESNSVFPPPSGQINGEVLDALRAGATFREIADAGGWKSTSTVHYRAGRALAREREAV